MKITKFYLNKASYVAENANGNRINIDIDYWGGKYKISKKCKELEDFARKLLKRKHRVNFIAHLWRKPRF